MSELDIYRFQSEFLQAAADLCDEPFTRFMEASEDGVEDTSYWVVSQGSAFYRNILKHPQQLPHSSQGLTSLVTVAGEVYRERFGLDLNLM